MVPPPFVLSADRQELSGFLMVLVSEFLPCPLGGASDLKTKARTKSERMVARLQYYRGETENGWRVWLAAAVLECVMPSSARTG